MIIIQDGHLGYPKVTGWAFAMVKSNITPDITDINGSSIDSKESLYIIIPSVPSGMPTNLKIELLNPFSRPSIIL